MTVTDQLNKQQLKDLFVQTFGAPEQRGRNLHSDGEEFRFFFAPGRVNLIGEHTDYSGGYVFPAALTFGTWAVARPREDGNYCFASTNFEGTVCCHISEVVYKKEDDWANYAKGVLSELSAFIEGEGRSAESVFKGADILYYGNIPNGAGLSSSASIELVTAVALTSIASLSVPMIDLVKLAQRAENEFVGVNCGIMDQFSVGLGRKDHAVMLKCDTLNYKYVPFQADGYRLVITNTNKRRGLADSKYNERRRECEEGLKQVQQYLPHIVSLGNLRYAEWEPIREKVTPEAVRNRLEHVIGENERVLSAVKCLEQDDLHTFGKLMKQSHISLRDSFDVTGRELDALFDAACRVDGCIGTRMTGAGFGGCTVSLVAEEAIKQFKETVTESYTADTGLTPDFYICDIGDGAKEMNF